MKASLLVEIGLEELPPQAMRTLADAFASGIAQSLDAAGIERGHYQRFVTPRRMAVLIDAVAASAPDYEQVTQGPGVDIAYDSEGQPTAAATGFARSRETTLEALTIEETNKGRRLVHRHHVKGSPLAEVFNSLLNDTVSTMGVPKRMRWGTNTTTFVRPVHWLTVLHDESRIDASVFGIESDRWSLGHRFHHPGPIHLTRATDYPAKLSEIGWVVADPDDRAELIQKQTQELASQFNARIVASSELLAEINALVEFPVALAGKFEPHYLELPREVLLATMEHHQRYIALEDDNGTLINRFITVANIQSNQPNLVISGNERVIRPRLDDALFFWQQDRARGLTSLIPGLSHVLFEHSLGSLADKQSRVARIAVWLCPLFDVTHQCATRAAELAKADLLTEMVGEFPDLQGIMGAYYAQHDGESEAVANAIRTQYQPTGGTGSIPQSALGRTLALADRLDTLAGIFAVDKRPTGDKDPYALRRAALGVVRLLIESEIHLDLHAAIRFALSVQPLDAPQGTAAALQTFHVERLRSYFLDRDTPPQDIDAVLASSSLDPVDIAARLSAVAAFKELPDASAVYEAHKRIRNILKKQNENWGQPVASYYQQAAEAELDRLMSEHGAQQDRVEGDYVTQLANLTTFAEPLAEFFNEVRVIVDDPRLRTNRLALLAAIDRQFCQVADISRLA